MSLAAGIRTARGGLHEWGAEQVTGRVEWTELGGDEAETVLANLLYSEYPSATRVRPSRGDFGIDVLKPNPREPGRFDDHQIKRYAQTLTNTQKRDIEKSFRRALIGLVRREVALADWYLNMPVDPTIDNLLDWFNAMPDKVIAEMFEDEELALTESEKQEIRDWRAAPGRIIKWEGRTFCDTLAAKYSYVIDYYLHGGAERLRQAVAAMTALLNRGADLRDAAAGVDTAASVTPEEMTAHLNRIFEVLDTDPHYRYGFSVDPSPPEILRQENLVAATQQIQPNGQTLTFRVFRRFAEAVHERPIPFNLRFAAEEAGFDADAYESWRKYGTPLTAPAEVELHLPGGLGAPFSGGLSDVSVQGAGHTYEARLRIRRSDGSVGEPITFSITARTGPEGTGMWETGTNQSGNLTFETKTNLDTGSGTWGFTRPRIVGEEINDILPSIEFLQDVTTGNVLQVAERRGPFVDYREIPTREPIFPDPVIDYLRALSTIQEATSVPVLVPDLTTITPADARAVIDAAALLSGQSVVTNDWSRAQFKSGATPSIGQNLEEQQVGLDKHYQIKIFEPLIVKVGTQELTLGTVERLLLSVKFELDENGVITALPFLNDTTYRTLSPGVPVPDRDNRPVQGKLLGTLAEAEELTRQPGGDTD